MFLGGCPVHNIRVGPLQFKTVEVPASSSSAQTSSTHCHWLSSLYIKGAHSCPNYPVALSPASPFQFFGIFHYVPQWHGTVILRPTQYSLLPQTQSIEFLSRLLSEKLEEIWFAPLLRPTAIIPGRILILAYLTKGKKKWRIFCGVYFQRWSSATSHRTKYQLSAFLLLAFYFFVLFCNSFYS